MSLAEIIAQITNPNPVFEDPENIDIDNATSAKTVEFTDEDELLHEFGAQSSLRLRNSILLHDTDSRYAGKKTTRRKLQAVRLSGEQQKDAGNEYEEEEEEEEDDDSENRDDETFESADEDELAKLNSQSDDDSAEEDTGDSEHSEGADDEPMNEEDDKDSTTNESFGSSALQTFSRMHLDDDGEQGMAVKSQLQIWDTLLEFRIKLQKSLLAANQLPQYDVWNAFDEMEGSDFAEAASGGQSAVKGLLDSLIDLQTLLLSRNTETKQVLHPGSAKGHNESDEDEEILSQDKNEDIAEEKIGMKRKLKDGDYPEYLQKRHAEFETFRNSTIQKWNDRTKVAAGRLKKSFASFEQSAVKQIEQILCDKERLIRRTQLKRSSYQLLGKKLCLDIENGEGKLVSGQEAILKQDSHLKDHDSEIFDDNDFYHQLLRELIERKTVDIHDPVLLGRQWLQIQKLRSKMKKKVDTKASKGRRIRYDVHPKLVNFMAPVEDAVGCTEEASNDLLSSLFGQRRHHDTHVTSEEMKPAET